MLYSAGYYAARQRRARRSIPRDRINDMSRTELEHQFPLLAPNSLEAATQLGGEGRIRTFGARPKKTRPTGC